VGSVVKQRLEDELKAVEAEVGRLSQLVEQYERKQKETPGVAIVDLEIQDDVSRLHHGYYSNARGG